MKVFCSIAWALAMVGTVGAATYSASTKEQLISLLKEHNGKSDVTIELAATDYNLTDEEAWNTHATAGTSHLYASALRIKGMGVRPEDTCLIGTGNMRVIQLVSSAKIENLTVTNGYAKKVAAYGESNRGGGVYGGIVTNCLITGNSAAAYGGGTAGNAKVYDSRIVGNQTVTGGGGIHSGSAYKCRISGNKSSGNGGGTMGCARLESCEIIDNAALGTGDGGGCFNLAYATNCLIAGNTARYAGGVHANNGKGAVVGCVISNNTASASGGGAYNIMLTNCTVVLNRSGSSGGGIASGDASYVKVYGSWVGLNSAGGDGGGIRGASVVSNCVVYGNIASNAANSTTCYGGGIKSSNAAGQITLVYDTEICGNASLTTASAFGCAGGVLYAELHNCDIHDNYSDYHGGGIRDCDAYDCRIWNNICFGSGLNAYGARLYRCDTYGTPLHGGSARDTTIRDIGPVVTLAGNPHISTNYAPTAGWHGYPCLTNCLITGISLPSNAMFSGVLSNPTKPSFLVNCTVVSNVCRNMFTCYTSAAQPMTVENCVFYGNQKLSSGVYSDCDLSIDTGSVNSDALHISHTAYGTASIASFADFTDGTVYKIGAADGVGTVIGATPGFCGSKDPKHPYALRRSSCLCERGVVQDWMVGAYDLRGDGFARLRDGLVDLGCYQCWLKAVGLVIKIN